MTVSLRAQIVLASLLGAGVAFAVFYVCSRYQIGWVNQVILGLLTAWAIGIFIARRSTGVLTRIARRASRILAGDYRQPDPLNSGDPKLDAIASTLAAVSESFREKTEDYERRLEESKSVLDDLTDAVIVVDSQLKILRVNPAAGVFFGQLPHELMVGRTLLESTLNHTLDDIVSSCISTRSAVDDFLDIHVPKPRATSVAVIPRFSGEDTVEGAIVLLHDISEIRRAEQISREFAAAASHELRTPIASIRVMADSLLNGALKDPDLGPRFVRSIEDSADRLASLVDDLLFLYAQESGKSTEVEVLNLSKIAENVCEKFAPIAQARGITLNSHLVSRARVVGDDQDFWRAIANLVENAIRYTDPGGLVTVSVTCEDKSKVVVSVKDNGIGIPADQLEKIFDRFYRVDLARSREMGGTGLGLSIVKGIIQKAGGEVSVKSEIGAGSQFTITLPMAKK